MSWKALVGWVIAAALIGGLVLVGIYCNNMRTGEPKSASVAQGKDGPELLVYNWLSNDDDPDEIRVTAIDARTGAKLGDRRFEEAGGMESCWTATPGLLWCEFARLALHDARSLDTVLAFDDAIDRAHLGHPVPQQWTTDGARGWEQLDDGRVARLDATTLTVDVDDHPPTLARPSSPSTSIDTSKSLTLHGKELTIDDGARATIVPGGAQFLNPGFVIEDNEPLIVDGDPVIVYSTSLDATRDRAQLARIDGKGAATWSVDVGGVIELIAHVDDLLVVATSNDDQRAIGIDARTGAVRWRFTD